MKPSSNALTHLGKRLLVRPIGRFMRREASSGQLLLFCTAFALIWAQPAYISDYHAFWHNSALPWLPYPMDTLHFWINDGLMALFFLVMGLEIKREILQGELSGWRRAALPLFAALGGVVAPALVYIGLAGRLAPAGWAIPTATDIAFSLGVLAIVGNRAPLSLRVFLTALAIVDDLIAIAIIAVFYTDTLRLAWLTPTVAVLAALVLLNRFKTAGLWPYIVGGIGLWVCLQQLGLHTTLAGVLLAAFVPTHLAERLEHRLHPLTSMLVIPLFALANAGIVIQADVVRTQLSHPITQGVLAGLVLGKPLGITLACWIAHGLRLAQLPEGVHWRHVIGVGCLGGIGFTMALLVTGLGLSDPVNQDRAKLGIVLGSLISALCGLGLLFVRTKR